MPKIYDTIPEETAADLNKISATTNKSFSKIVNEILELGLQLYKKGLGLSSQKLRENLTKFDLKNREYLLRILNINSEILRKLYNDYSKRTDHTAELLLTESKTQSQKHVKTKLT